MKRRFHKGLIILLLMASIGCAQTPSEIYADSLVKAEGKIIKNQLSDKKRDELNQSTLCANDSETPTLC